MAKRIRTYASRDSEIRGIVADLERDATQVAAPMAAMEIKAMRFSSNSVLRSRDFEGKARKS